MKTKDWKEMASALKSIVVITDTPCAASGHTLRTRAGHCVQCDTSKIAYTKRMSDKAAVYVARSKKGRLIKVGTATNVADRAKKLSGDRYGGQTDWEIVRSVVCENSGAVEMDVHKGLEAYRVRGIYDNRDQECRELFACDETLAITVLRGAMSKK